MPSGTAQWALSLVAHAAIGTVLLVLRPPSRPVATSFVSMADEKAEKPKPPPPPPPAPPQDGPQSAKREPTPTRAPARAKPDAAPAADNAPSAGPDLDLGLSNDGGPGGLSVPASGGGGPAPAKTAKPVEKRLQPTAAQEETCDGPTSKPRALSVPQPAYPESARAAGISGKVRVEVSVDAQGSVTSARVLSGLGHGLDEAALRAAQSAKFSPALRCGKPIAATFVIGMRFAS